MGQYLTTPETARALTECRQLFSLINQNYWAKHESKSRTAKKNTFWLTFLSVTPATSSATR